MLKEKKEALRLKIIEANPRIIINKNAQLIKFDHSVEYFEQTRPIELADVLIALKSGCKEKYSEDFNGDTIYEGQIEYERKALGLIRQWDLTKPYSEQSDETLLFLYNLLVK